MPDHEDFLGSLKYGFDDHMYHHTVQQTVSHEQDKEKQGISATGE